MIANRYTSIDEHRGAPIEIDLCALLQTMNLETEKIPTSDGQTNPLKGDVPDVPMSEDLGYQSDAASDCSSSNLSSSNEEPYGCAYLKAIRTQLDNYSTTSGEYLEAIFTHREILSSFPGGHRECARGFSDIAYLMEKRAWRADRDADMEAVTAFRHEAWVIAASL